MEFGADPGYIRKMVSGQNAINSCRAPSECCACKHLKDDSSIISQKIDRACMHPSTFRYSLDGFDISRGRPTWCPYNMSVVRN